MIRSFVGIRLPARVAAILTAAQAGLPAGRPVAPENFHLTLAFLGEHPEPVVEDVHHALAEIRARRFELSLSGLDAFGNGRVRVVCARVRLTDALSGLNASVRQAARRAGIELPRERFTPHVSICRCGGKGATGEDARKLRDFAALRSHVQAAFELETFALIRSHLGQGGAHYEDLAEYHLI